jgi:hypothetical protein
MAMKSSARLVRRFATAAALAGLAAGAALAGPVYRARVTLPNEVHWGGAVLPAGEYTLAMDTVAGPLRIVDSSGRIRALVSARPGVAASTRPTAILITRDGSQRTVRSFNCPPWGHKFVFRTFPREQRGLVAREDQLEIVAVRMASR